jgi:DNA-binding transcriptional ArsR family regulator
MSNSKEEETYSTIFESLKHPIRRKILRVLSDRPRSFSEMQSMFKLESSHLAYHLESLGSLLYKSEDGKYGLSMLGEATRSMMHQAEEFTKPLRLPSLSIKWKALLVILMAALAFSASLGLALYAENERSHSLLGLLRSGGAFWTDKYVINSSATYSAPYSAALGNHNFSTCIVGVRKVPAIYNVMPDSTLEINFTFTSFVPHATYLSLSIQEELTFYSVNGTTYVPIIWSTNVNTSNTFSVPLPSTAGLYSIFISEPENLPSEIKNYTITYTMTLRMRSQGKYVMFLIFPGFLS